MSAREFAVSCLAVLALLVSMGIGIVFLGLVGTTALMFGGLTYMTLTTAHESHRFRRLPALAVSAVVGLITAVMAAFLT